MTHHLVVGAGPVGTGTALRLASEGHTVTMLTRSGSGPQEPGITLVAADAGNADLLTRHAANAASIVNAVNPPYTKWQTMWPPLHKSFLGAAERTGARLVMMDNLYAYGRPTRPGGVMKDLDPLRPCSKKGSVRAQMAEEMFGMHHSGRIRATSAIASDFFGPGVIEAQIGQSGFERLMRGKRIDALGRVDVPHSFTYMPDVTTLLTRLCTDDTALGRSWHVPSAPPRHVREVWADLAQRCGAPAPSFRILRGTMLHVAGAVVPIVRELREVAYQFEEPFAIEATDAERSFGITATAWSESLSATAEFWKARLNSSSVHGSRVSA